MVTIGDWWEKKRAYVDSVLDGGHDGGPLNGAGGVRLGARPEGLEEGAGGPSRRRALGADVVARPPPLALVHGRCSSTNRRQTCAASFQSPSHQRPDAPPSMLCQMNLSFFIDWTTSTDFTLSASF